MQGPTALAVVAGGGCLDIFFLSSISSLFVLPLSGRRPEKKAVNPKTTNHLARQEATIHGTKMNTNTLSYNYKIGFSIPKKGCPRYICRSS